MDLRRHRDAQHILQQSSSNGVPNGAVVNGVGQSSSMAHHHHHTQSAHLRVMANSIGAPSSGLLGSLAASLSVVTSQPMVM